MQRYEEMFQVYLKVNDTSDVLDIIRSRGCSDLTGPLLSVVQDLDTKIQLLEDLDPKLIDLEEVLEQFPSNFPIHKLEPVIISAYSELHNKQKHMYEVERYLTQWECQETQFQLMKEKLKHFDINPGEICFICQTEIDEIQGFARRANGQKVHYGCINNKQ